MAQNEQQQPSAPEPNRDVIAAPLRDAEQHVAAALRDADSRPEQMNSPRRPSSNSPGCWPNSSTSFLHNKKWWLTPIILTLLLIGVLVVLSGTAVAPFIYTLW